MINDGKVILPNYFGNGNMKIETLSIEEDNQYYDSCLQGLIFALMAYTVFSMAMVAIAQKSVSTATAFQITAAIILFSYITHVAESLKERHISYYLKYTLTATVMFILLNRLAEEGAELREVNKKDRAGEIKNILIGEKRNHTGRKNPFLVFLLRTKIPFAETLSGQIRELRQMPQRLRYPRKITGESKTDKDDCFPL